MRASTSAVYFAAAGREATMDAARCIAALTHGDRAAWEGTAVFHELVRLALAGDDPIAALPEVLAPGWRPSMATESNGAVWPGLASAVWAVRTTADYESMAIPARWIESLHVPVPGWGDRVLRCQDLVALAERLASAY